MAQIYDSTPVLAKIQLGGTTYYLKDADVRDILDTFGNIVTYTANTSVANDSTIPTGAAIISYISTAVADLEGAMHFVGSVDTLPTDLSIYDNGDVVVETTTGKEYVILVKDGTASAIELGDEKGHVHTDRSIAGLTLDNDITVAALQGALELKALAYKDSASGTLDDYANGITGATYTPAGTVTVTLGDDTNTTSLTSTGSYTPAGEVKVTPTSTSITGITNVGTLPSLTSGTTSFATAGLVGTVANETLTLTDATTDTAINSITFDEGSLPTKDTAATDVLTGVAATFVGDEASLSVSTTYSKQVVKSAGFSGTEATITPTLTTTTKSVTVA